MKIVFCSSTSFFDKLPQLKKELEEKGIEAVLPIMDDFHHLEEDALAKIHYNLIKEHFKKIDNSQAVFIANYEKKGIKGYIGGNTFLEMGKAFDKGIPIFLLNDIPKEIMYREELIAMQPIVIGTDWDKLKKHMKSE